MNELMIFGRNFRNQNVSRRQDIGGDDCFHRQRCLFSDIIGGGDGVAANIKGMNDKHTLVCKL